MGKIRAGLVAAVVCLVGASVARADEGRKWQVAVAAGDEVWRSPNFGTNGWGLVDANRSSTHGSRIHLLWNTDTLYAGLEGIKLAGGKLEISIAARGEALLAGVLFQYYQQGNHDSGRSFFASYANLLPSLKWHPAPRHSVEVVLGMRAWFFNTRSGTDSTFTLPPNMFVFEPRVSYTYWSLHADQREWEAHRFNPRITGLAFGVILGIDRRTDHRAWGADIGGGQLDPRNNPGAVTFTLRQWGYAGANLGTWGRLQFEEHMSYGHGEDDLTRNRSGGMNPYVIPIPGLPWAALLNERLFAGQVSLHVKVGKRGVHEIGPALAGGAFNDPYRVGKLSTYGGAGGLAAFADLRFGNWQVNLRVGYAFPTAWLLNSPRFSGLVTAGVIFR